MLFIVIGNIATNTATDCGNYSIVIKVQSSTPKLPYRGVGVILGVVNLPPFLGVHKVHSSLGCVIFIPFHSDIPGVILTH